MNIIGFLRGLLSGNPLDAKVRAIGDEIKQKVKPFCHENFLVDYYGAYDIDPKHLVFWVCVQSDKAKAELSQNSDLNSLLRQTLVNHNYPEKARLFVSIGFESQETVDRESAGNWYHHFK